MCVDRKIPYDNELQVRRARVSVVTHIGQGELYGVKMDVSMWRAICKAVDLDKFE